MPIHIWIVKQTLKCCKGRSQGFNRFHEFGSNTRSIKTLIYSFPIISTEYEIQIYPTQSITFPPLTKPSTLQLLKSNGFSSDFQVDFNCIKTYSKFKTFTGRNNAIKMNSFLYLHYLVASLCGLTKLSLNTDIQLFNLLLTLTKPILSTFIS